ncbi:hypothetical protein [Shewanella donghaensis]|uniref:hypothetical protein n=1 Tax=Shewanella donghaensis TaxID=238836 RepID=UPI001181D2C4|nr:hypothetical protein [Shewanella donghaensis]
MKKLELNLYISKLLIILALVLIVYYGYLNRLNGIELSMKISIAEEIKQPIFAEYEFYDEIDTLPINTEIAARDFYQLLNGALLQSSPQIRSTKIKQLLSLWMNEDILAVLIWLEQQPFSHEVGEYYSPIIQRYRQDDIESAGELILSLPNYNTLPSIVLDYVSYLAEIDSMAAAIWIDSISDETLKIQAQRQLLQTWSQHSPHEVIQHLIDNADINVSIRADIIKDIVNQISRNEPLATIQSLHLYPEEFQIQIAYSLISHWKTSAQHSAVEWINTLDGRVKDKAVHSYIDYFGVTQNPLNSFTLVTKMRDSPLKNTLLLRVLKQWHQVSPLAAKSHLLNSTNLSQQNKEKILQDLSF